MRKADERGFEVASLVEELVTVLEEEEKIYQTLISYGEKRQTS